MSNDAKNLLLESLKEESSILKAVNKEKERVNMGEYIAGVIGVGAAGGNVANLLTEHGYYTAAFNTTAADMVDLNVHIAKAITNLDGSGKDRAFSSTQFKRSYKNFFNDPKIQELVKHDLIFVIGSGGGGTGTILSIMTAGYLKHEYPNKTIFIVGLLGSIKEDLISQRNMREFISDLEHKSGCPYLLFDNNKVKNKMGDDVYAEVNQEAANAIRILSKEYFVENTRSNIDGRDYARLTSFGGLTSVISVNDLNISVTEENVDLKSRVVTAMNESTIVTTKDPEAYGFFMNTDSDLYKAVDTTFDNIQNEIGQPTAGLVFRHLQNYTNQGPEFAIIMTGMESPVDRFKMIEKRIEEYETVKPKNTLPKVEERQTSSKLAGDTSDNDTGSGGSFLDQF